MMSNILPWHNTNDNTIATKCMLSFCHLPFNLIKKLYLLSRFDVICLNLNIRSFVVKP